MKKIISAILLSMAVMFTSTASAVVDVTAPVAAFTTEGTSAISSIGTAMLILAGIAVTYKWAKASFFG